MVVLRFADLSHHQAGVNLTAYAEAGHDRVIFKATEGTSFVDSTFVARWQEAGRLNLARVAYHFARAENSGATEFDFFRSVVDRAGGLGPRDRLCLDAEDTATPGRAAAHAAQFTSRATAAGHPVGLVYTGGWYANPNGLGPDVFAAGWQQLWLSDYGSNPDTAVTLPHGWTRAQLVARQYTDHATVGGVDGTCDYNRVVRDWLSSAPPDLSPPEDHDMYVVRRSTDAVTYLVNPAALAGQDRVRPIGQAELDALNAIGVPVKLSVPAAHIVTLRALLGAGVDLDLVITHLTSLRAAVGDDEAHILAKLADLRLTLDDVQIASIAEQVGINYDRIADAVRTELADALSTDPKSA